MSTSFSTFLISPTIFSPVDMVTVSWAEAAPAAASKGKIQHRVTHFIADRMVVLRFERAWGTSGRNDRAAGAGGLCNFGYPASGSGCGKLQKSRDDAGSPTFDRRARRVRGDESISLCVLSVLRGCLDVTT